jgi:hypothetical protein
MIAIQDPPVESAVTVNEGKNRRRPPAAPSAFTSSLRKNAIPLGSACYFLAAVLVLRVLESFDVSVAVYAIAFTFGVCPPVIVLLIWLGRR